MSCTHTSAVIIQGVRRCPECSARSDRESRQNEIDSRQNETMQAARRAMQVHKITLAEALVLVKK